jgi:hypothetical protein
MTEFTVIGVDDETGAGSSFAVVVEAESAGQAEQTIGPRCRVVFVLTGAHALDPQGIFPIETHWTVAAFYPDNEQRYACAVQAQSATEAEAAAHAQARENNETDPDDESPIVVVGAVLGDHQCADVYAGDEGWAAAPSLRPDWQEFDYSS